MQIFGRRKIEMCRNVRNSYGLAGVELEEASVGSVFCKQLGWISVMGILGWVNCQCMNQHLQTVC